MRNRLTAVVYGVGAMGSLATRLMMEKGVTLVGAIARSPNKVGRDLGDVAGLGISTGVIVQNDAERVLVECHPDIAILTVASYMEDMFEHYERCARLGVNSISIAEEALYPWVTSPMLTARLDALAKANGVTLVASGHQDTYWVNMVRLLMGTAHVVKEVYGKASWNVDDYGPEVAKDQRVGSSTEEFETWLGGAVRPPSFGRNTLGALIGGTGLTVETFETTTRPEIATTELRSQSLDIVVPAGRVIGFTDVDTARTAQGVTFQFEMSGRLYAAGDADINEWSLVGEPPLRLLNAAVPTKVTTCTQLVNRIPDVLNARPGFVTVDQLPLLQYRAFPLATYVEGQQLG